MKQKEFITEELVYKEYEEKIRALKDEHEKAQEYNTGYVVVDYNPIKPFHLFKLPSSR